jgi:NAD(P)-dependent dehydrogenase (short-subunit alcohol dehydrogenase family)
VELELSGQVAVVTGASKGIGLAVVTALVNEGVHVVAGARSASAEIVALVDAGSVTFVATDLAAPDGPDQLVAEALERGRLDILVNNVGAVTPRMNGFLDVTDEEWFRSLTLNLMAAVRTTRAALPMMLEAGRGSIVMTSSVNAYLPSPGVMDYSAAKAALSSFSKALSMEVGPRGVRVNTVSPGPVHTDMWLGTDGIAQRVAQVTGSTPEDVAAGTASGSVTGRFSDPAEVADAVLFLASRRSGNTTGANLVIDGGIIPTL